MSKEIDREMEDYFEAMPFLEKLGIEQAIIEDGIAEFHIPYDDSLTNHTVVHGGVIATLLDATVAGAIHSDAEATLDEMEPLTIDMTTNFHAPIRGGDIVARAELVNRGRTIAVGRAEIMNDGDLAASGTATYFQRWQ